MDVKDSTKQSLKNLSNVINNSSFKTLLENCFALLRGSPEKHNMNSLFGSKPNIVKEAYAGLLSVTAEFVRHSISSEEVADFLTRECSLSKDKVKMYTDMYVNNKQEVEISLLNIGTYLPHVTDVNWKIDYIVKSNATDESDGPLVRISLCTEVYDKTTQGKKMEYVNFTCNSQELQNLVYKLKDAVKHCQHIATEH